MTATGDVVVNIGQLRLEVSPGDAALQRIAWLREPWERVLHRHAPGLADQVLDGLDSATNEHGGLTRGALTDLGAAGKWPAAYVGVIAWGAGPRWGRFYRNLCRGLELGHADRLVGSWVAAPQGLDALWSAHFTARPLGLGRPSYGSKWLHMAGWGRTPEGAPGPVVYDMRVWLALTRCGAITEFASPNGAADSRRRASWITWCEQAEAAARGTAANAADVERAVFEHAGHCKRAQRGTAYRCLGEHQQE